MPVALILKFVEYIGLPVALALSAFFYGTHHQAGIDEKIIQDLKDNIQLVQLKADQQNYIKEKTLTASTQVIEELSHENRKNINDLSATNSALLATRLQRDKAVINSHRMPTNTTPKQGTACPSTRDVTFLESAGERLVESARLADIITERARACEGKYNALQDVYNAKNH